MRGRWHEVRGVPIRVTYHPAALLRNPQWKRPTWEDMQAVRDPVVRWWLKESHTLSPCSACLWSSAGPPTAARPSLPWRLRKALLVVAFLALQPHRRAEREKLVDAVWPEASAETVRYNFHPHPERRAAYSGSAGCHRDPARYLRSDIGGRLGSRRRALPGCGVTGAASSS